MYLNKDAILNSLTKEDIIKICSELGCSDYKEDSHGNLCFSTSLCHGGDSPYKLIYYLNSKSFHCFAGETKVITREGLKTVRELSEKECEILNGNGEWEKTVFHNYGKQQLMKITSSCNGKTKEIYATPEHEWIIHSYWYKKQTQQLKKGMRLEKILPLKIDNFQIIPEAVCHGFVYGDGTINGYYQNGNKYTSVHFFTKEKLQLVKYFEIDNWHFRTDILHGEKYLCAYKTTYNNYKQVPDISKSVSYLLSFLAGYFVADGNNHKNRLSIYSHKKEDLLKVQNICIKCGIATYHISEYNIKAGKRGCVVLNKDTQAYNLRLVRSTIPDCFFITNKGQNSCSDQKGRLRWTIIKVEKTNRYEDVYCCQTSTHSFALEDYILTGNCFTCSDTYGIVELVIRAKRQQGQNFSWYKAMHFIATTTGKLYESTPEENQNKTIITDFEWMNRLKTVQKRANNIPNLTEINENILFWYAPYQGWLDEHISREALSRFEIGYYGLTNQITIPHRDSNGRLIGIRGRYLNETDAKTFGKYVPLYINGEFLSHQLGSNLYGLHVVKDKILQCKKIMLVEAEKSVLQAYSYFREDSFVVGLCGFNITYTQIKIILKELKVEEVIVGFDRDYEDANSYEAMAYYQNIVKKVAPLVPYCSVYLVMDKQNRLGYKDSPTDKGKDVLIELMKEKILITMDDVNEVLGKKDDK